MLDNSLGILLLHGFTSSLDTINGLIPYLEENNIPYAMPILRGHGSKYQDLIGVTWRDWYADAEEALLKLAKETNNIIIMGLSMGGLIAIDLAIAHKDKINALALVAPALKFKDPLTKLVGLLKIIFKFWKSPNMFNDKECAKNNTGYEKFATDSFASLCEYGNIIQNKLSQLTTPTLILHSHKDNVISPKSAKIIHNNISSEDKKIVWFEHSGHEMLQDLEKELVFKTLIDYFLLIRDKII